jgi:hypothetical protein
MRWGTDIFACKFIFACKKKRKLHAKSGKLTGIALDPLERLHLLVEDLGDEAHLQEVSRGIPSCTPRTDWSSSGSVSPTVLTAPVRTRKQDLSHTFKLLNAFLELKTHALELLVQPLGQLEPAGVRRARGGGGDTRPGPVLVQTHVLIVCNGLLQLLKHLLDAVVRNAYCRERRVESAH